LSDVGSSITHTLAARFGPIVTTGASQPKLCALSMLVWNVSATPLPL
jgi:hypothetical protein